MHLLHDSNSLVLTGFPTSRRPQNKQGTPRKTARMGKDFERVESVQDCARRGLHERPLLLEKCAVRSLDRRTRSSSSLVVVKTPPPVYWANINLVWRGHTLARKAEGLLQALLRFVLLECMTCFEMVMNNIILTALHKRERVNVYRAHVSERMQAEGGRLQHSRGKADRQKKAARFCI